MVEQGRARPREEEGKRKNEDLPESLFFLLFPWRLGGSIFRFDVESLVGLARGSTGTVQNF
jgi:hypothetical protein